jgi:phosphoglycerate dehydrogenase-like enzyme
MDLIELAPLEARLKRQDLTLLLDHADEMNVTDAKRLSRFENCRVYPPIAYLTDEATYLKKQLYVDNLKNFLNGKPTNKVS